MPKAKHVNLAVKEHEMHLSDEIIPGKNLDDMIQSHEDQMNVSTNKFVIPNVKQNQNILIASYIRSHDCFSKVVDQIESTGLRRSKRNTVVATEEQIWEIEG